MIPAAAVEAAAKAWRSQAWLDGALLEYSLRAALEAAAPHMLAGAWDEGYAAESDYAPPINPYRPADAR